MENQRFTDTPQRTPRPYAVTPSPYTETPSPYALSIMSTRISTKPANLQLLNLILRGIALIFSLIAVLTLALAAASADGKAKGSPCSSFSHSPDYWYSVSVAFLSLVYTALQLLKGIIDIALMGLIPEKTLEYASFIIDQLVAYLLVSSTSVLVTATFNRVTAVHCRKMINSSVSMFFLCFLAVSASAVLSGYKLCKRFIW